MPFDPALTSPGRRLHGGLDRLGPVLAPVAGRGGLPPEGYGERPLRGDVARRRARHSVPAMSEILRQVWLAVRPITAQQRFLWWCGTLMLASGAVHAVVAVVDGAPWWGAVSWRKPVVFGMSFGILAWSAVWVHAPAAGAAVGVAAGRRSSAAGRSWSSSRSRCSGGGARRRTSTTDTSFDAAVWAVMSKAIIVVALARGGAAGLVAGAVPRHAGRADRRRGRDCPRSW